MSSAIQLTAADGFGFSAYVAHPAGEPRGRLLILPEIFGVNSHIRSVTDRYAAHGYLAIAPGMFDRAQPGLDLGYSDDDVRIGQNLMRQLNWKDALLDLDATASWGGNVGKTAIVGYCWGGTAAWVAASKATGVDCAVSYYGNAITTVMDATPRIPMMLHWGERDHLISLDQIRSIESSAPAVVSWTYATGHGFNCDQRSLYHPEFAKLAERRTLAFLDEHMA